MNAPVRSWWSALPATAGGGVRFGLVVAAVLALTVLGFAVRDRGVPADGTTVDPASAAGAADVAVPGVAADPAGGRDAAGPDGGAGSGAVPSSDPAVPDGSAPVEVDAVEWVSARAPSPVAPIPPDARVPRPGAVRGVYVGSWSAGSERALERLVGLADATEINAFVIDIKDVTGEVSHRSRVPLAEQVGATRNIRIGDVRGLLERLKAHGIYPIARIVVFKDPLLAEARPDWAIRAEDGSLWADDKGVHWIDAYNREVWDYNIELAREAVALGFSEVQWDYVRFPDAPQAYMARAVYPAREGRGRTDAIRAFMAYSRDRLADLEVPVTADVFGVTTSAYSDVGIGQLWEEMADVMDVLLPMVYPSHYPRGTWGFANPNAAPYQIVKKALDHGVSRSRNMGVTSGIRPWLQAFSLGQPAYGPEHVRAQIDAVYDAGLTEWILWDPAIRYSREALATADGTEPWFAGRGASLYAEPGDSAETRRPGAPVGVPLDG